MSEIIPLKPVHSFSYTRCSNDEECRMKRYLGREWGGTGLQPVQSGWDLVFGNVMHKGLEDFAKSGQLDLQGLQQKLKEQAQLSGFDAIAARDWATLGANLLVGFQRYIWPALMAEYEILETEGWIHYEPEPGFLFRARQDLLLRNKFDGHIAYVDYKTTRSNRPQWVSSWSKSIQLHSSMYAMRKTTNYDVERSIVIGLNKGYKDDKNNIPCRSPMNYGYANRQYAMSPEYSYEYQRSKGWEMFAVGEEFEDPTQWVYNMPTPLLSEQFPQTGPIFARDDIAETWFRQQMIREHEVADALVLLESITDVVEIQPVLDKYFRQNFSKCKPAYGYGCEFEPYCWIPSVQADPLNSTYFKRYESDLIEVE